jgi:hypothetical protein
MLLFQWVPFTASVRLMARFGFVTMMAVSVLAGYGLWQILQARWRPGLKRVAASIITGLVLLELWSGPIPWWTETKPRPVDLWLAQRDRPALVLEFPLVANVSGKVMLYQTYHQQPLFLGGVLPAFRNPLWLERTKELFSFPDTASLAAARRFRIRYLVMTPALFPSAAEWESFQARLQGLPGVRFRIELGGVLVYELAPA